MKMNRAGLLAGCLIWASALVYTAEVDEGSAEAQEITEEAASKNLSAGTAGLLVSLESLQTYYNQSQIIKSSTVTAQVLAGPKAYYRRAQNELTLRNGAKAAAEIGAQAREVIAENQISYRDYETLLRIVEAEVTGGDVYSKMLIAGVVLNRVADSHFPDNITDVVWEVSEDGSAQFSPTADGRINTVTVTESTVEAVNRVLEGEDHTQGALFFVARNAASAESVYWFDSQLEVLYAYGGHDFFTYRDYASE